MTEGLTQDKAVDIARSWLKENGFTTDRRTVKASKQKDAYVVVFSVPPDTLGGDYTLHVDATTGEVVDTKFER